MVGHCGRCIVYSARVFDRYELLSVAIFALTANFRFVHYQCLDTPY